MKPNGRKRLATMTVRIALIVSVAILTFAYIHAKQVTVERTPYPVISEDYTGTIYAIRIMDLDRGTVVYCVDIGHVELGPNGEVLDFDGNRQESVKAARKILESIGER